MNRSGQVWESQEQGVHIVLWVEDYKGMGLAVMLGVDYDKIGYLPEYVLTACENAMLSSDEATTWQRLA